MAIFSPSGVVMLRFCADGVLAVSVVFELLCFRDDVFGMMFWRRCLVFKFCRVGDVLFIIHCFFLVSAGLLLLCFVYFDPHHYPFPPVDAVG